MLEDDITPITLIELTLLLLFFVLLIYYISVPGSYKYDNSKEIISKLNGQLKQLETEIEKYKAILSRKDLKSRQLPTCKEVGLTNDSFIATVTIAGANKFQISDKEYTYADLKELYRSDLEKAEEYECVHCIKAFVKRGISLEEYHKGYGKLREFFYVTPKWFE